MSVIYRTADVADPDRIDLVRQLLRDSFGPMDLHPPAEDGHPAAVFSLVELGAVRALEARQIHTNGPCSVVRRDRHVQQADSRYYRIDLPLAGHIAVSQDGREAGVDAGSLVLTDQTRPARWVNSSPWLLTLAVPFEMLPLRADEVAEMTARRIGPGSASLAVGLARQMIRIGSTSCADSVRLGTALVDVLTVTLAAQLDRPVRGETAQHALLARIYAFVEERLGDPDLGPSTVAVAHHVSERHLHRLFELEGHTAAGWIRRRRLEQCRRDLTDPRLRDRPVSAIAARWGITSPGHFNRVFKAAFGMTPGEYRRVH